MTRIAIIGATSAIAQETAKCYATEGASFFLAARDGAKLAEVAADLRVRGAAAVDVFVADLSELARLGELVAAAGDDLDAVLIAHGTLPHQLAIDSDAGAQVAAFELNATSMISLAARFAILMERRGHGTLAVIGSVAGDRGRRSNYVYGAAKAAVHAYCDGFRARLRPSGVSVVLIKPGWVDTPMTDATPKNALFISAAEAGRTIHKAMVARKGTVYVPWFWRWISLLVQMLPERFVKF